MPTAISHVRISQALREWASQCDANVAITGATGWIGAALAHLCSDLGLDQASGRLRLFGASPRIHSSRGRDFAIEDLSDASPLGAGQWLVFHLAFLGKERTEDLAAENFNRINDAVLQQARALAETADSLRFVFSSSGAVYQSDRQLVGETSNPYGYMKVCHEAEIRSWAAARSIPLVNSRIFNIGGPYINKQARYALSDFILQARQSGAITIGAAKPVFRSFVHVAELACVLFEAVLNPALTYLSFDTGGREVVEMGDLAASVGRVLGLSDLIIKRPDIVSESQTDWYVGDAKIYQSILAKSGMIPVGLDHIIEDTASFMSQL